VISVADRYYSSRLHGNKISETASLTTLNGTLSEMKTALQQLALDQVNGAELKKNGQVYNVETKRVVYSRSMRYFSDDIWKWEILTRAEIKKMYGVDAFKLTFGNF